MSMLKVSIKKHNIYILIYSLFLAVILSSIPWEYFRTGGFGDRLYYITYIDFISNRIEWFDFSGLLNKIFNEWGWHYFLNFLQKKFGFDSSVILFLVSLFALTVAFFVVSLYKRFYLCLFLINPMYIDFFYSQIRLSFAIAFVYLSVIMFDKNKLLSVIILIPSFFIHTSSFIFIFIFYSAVFLAKVSFISSIKKYLISLLVGAIAAIATGPYMSVILGSFDDRRAEEYGDFSSPVLYMIYWIGLFLFIGIKAFSNKIDSLNIYYFYITSSILTMVFLSIFLGGYPSRFIVASFPFIILAISEFRGKNEFAISFLYILYTAILWIFWVS